MCEIEEQKVDQKNVSPTEVVLSYITLNITADGSITIDTDWLSEINSEFGSDMGEALYALTSGILNPEIQRVILSKIHQDYLKKPYALKMLESWQKALESNDQNPVVPPYETLKRVVNADEYQDLDDNECSS